MGRPPSGRKHFNFRLDSDLHEVLDYISRCGLNKTDVARAALAYYLFGSSGQGVNGEVDVLLLRENVKQLLRNRGQSV